MLVVVVLILCTSRYLFQYLEPRTHDDIVVIAAITMMSLCTLAEKKIEFDNQYLHLQYQYQYWPVLEDIVLVSGNKSGISASLDNNLLSQLLLS